MNTEYYVIDKDLMKQAKASRIFSIIATSLAVGLFFEACISVLLSLIPIPIFGVVIFIVSWVTEFCLSIGIIVCNAFATHIRNDTLCELSTFDDPLGKRDIKSVIKWSKILTWISNVLLGITFIPICILNIIELILSII